MAIVCPNCSTDLPDDAVFCDQCGSSLDAPAVSAPAAAPSDEPPCPQCGAPTIPGEAFCDHCGAPLEEPDVVAPPEPAPPEPEFVEPEPEVEVEPEPAVEIEPESELEPEPEVMAEPAPPAPAVPGLDQCPSCGAENLPGSKFCSNCGMHMEDATPEVATPTTDPEPVVVPVVAEPEPPTPGDDGKPPRLIVRDTGAEILLPTDEGDYVIGREDPVSRVFPEVDLEPHQGEHLGVSRRHAQLTVQAGLYFIQDLDSTNFTFINRQKLAPNTPTALSNADEVRLGKLVMTFLG